MLQRLRGVQPYQMVGILLAVLSAPYAYSWQEPRQGLEASQPNQVRRDGQHDFDFDIGVWKTDLRRLVQPLSGSTNWVEYEGTTVVRKLWGGRANLAELEADGPSGHIEVLSLRLYDPGAHQWSLNSANVETGTISIPTIGEFKNGRGEFYDTETIIGKSILLRNVWSDITPNSCRFEQAFSDDGGKTWEVNWIAVDTRTEGKHKTKGDRIGSTPPFATPLDGIGHGGED